MDPLESWKVVDPLESSACPKMGARPNQTLVLQERSRLVMTQALGEAREALGEFWERFGKV